MEKMFSWLQHQQECHGSIVSWVAALIFLLAATCILALLFAIVGLAMWVSPYLATGLTMLAAGFMIYKQY